jgi:acetyltransferase EpsM
MGKTNKVVVIGGHGTSLNIAESIIDAQVNFDVNIQFIGFVNDVLENVNGYKVVCKISELKNYLKTNDYKVIYALYKPDKMEERIALHQEIEIPINRYFNFIHPTCFISKSAKIGIGNTMLPYTILHSNVIMGNFNVLNSGVIVEHDTIVGNSNFIAASTVIGSNVLMKNGIFLGLNSTIRESVIINDFTFLGMGSVLTKNTLTKSIYYGVPAKRP